MTTTAQPKFALILLVQGLYVGELAFHPTDRAKHVTFMPTAWVTEPLTLANINALPDNEYIVLVHEVDPDLLQQLVSTSNDDLLAYYAEEWFGDERFVTQAEFVLAADRQLQIYLSHPTLDKKASIQQLGEEVYIPTKAARVQGLNPLLGEYVALRRSQVVDYHVDELQVFIEEQLKAADLLILEKIDTLNVTPAPEVEEVGDADADDGVDVEVDFHNDPLEKILFKDKE